MKVTEEKMDELVGVAERQFDKCYGEAECTRGDAFQHVIEAVLALIEPDVQPYAFPGYPASAVWLHPCGEVIEVAPGSDRMADVEAGWCDCESGQPWQRIYVKCEAGK